ncbi:MAG TPA: recombinase family protein [Pirellulales bacterium]|jgi:site-specific DNA recombinase
MGEIVIATSKIRAVAYYRMSTDRQDTSIASQRKEVEAYAKKHGYMIARDYIDEGISGDATEKRKQFQQLIADAAGRRDFDAILCWDQDRFGRFNSMEAGFYIHPLMKAGVHLATIAQGRVDWNDFAGRMIFSIQQEGKHQYLIDLSRNASRGRRDRFLEGKWSGKPAYGYILGADGHLALGDPSEIAVVQSIFSMRVDEGMGQGSIATRLNEQGIRAPRGGTWNVPAVRNILTRETYTGAVTLGIDQRGKYFSIAGGEVERVTAGMEKRTPLIIPNCHPPIIDQKTWEACAAITTRSIKIKSHARNGKEGAPLAGLLFCGRCGSPMYAVDYRGVGPGYLCAKNHTRGGCGHCKVPQGKALALVASMIRERVLGGSLEALEAAIERQLGRRSQPTDLQALRQQIAEIDRKLEQGAERLVSVDDSLVPVIERKLLDLKAQRKAIERELQAKPAKPPRTAREIAADVWRLDEVLRTGSPRKVRHALSQIVKGITLDFVPGAKTGRGQRYDFTGGRMELLPKEGQSPRRRRS